jgi:Mg2+ and Co2+ transporter CorA
MAPLHSQRGPVAPAAPGLRVALVTASGVISDASFDKIRDLLLGDALFWVDLVGADASARADWIGTLGLDASDAAWLQRFGQAGRAAFDQRRLRVATWLSEGPGHGLTEIHLLGWRRCVLTAWDGNPAALDNVRERLVASLSTNPDSSSATVAVLLQLILSTLHDAISSVDAQLVTLQRQLAVSPDSLDFTAMTTQTRRLQSIWSEVERYSQSFKCAMIGLETLSIVDVRGAEALASYAEQVEDLESRLKVRSEWGAEMMRDYATALANNQTLQISRLTMVSIIFLPITFLTGFFGMNFPWMIRFLGGPTAFGALGLALPAISVVTTTLWLLSRRRHFMGHGRPGRRKGASAPPG